MARETNAVVTYEDLHYMVNNEGYAWTVSQIPVISPRCMDKDEILTETNAIIDQESSFDSTQLVPYQYLSPPPPINNVPLTISISSTNITTSGANDGTATVTVLTGTAPFDYIWDDQNGTIVSTIYGNNSTTNTINNLAPGTYTVTVTDNTGQIAILSAIISDSLEITENTKIIIYFDSSGSMDDLLPQLKQTVGISASTGDSTIFKDKMIQYYNGDEIMYDNQIELNEFASERTYKMLGEVNTDISTTNNIIMVFQDEARDAYYTNRGTSDGDVDIMNNNNFYNDISAFNSQLGGWSSDFYRGIIFQVINPGYNPNDEFKVFLQDVQQGNRAPYNNQASYNLQGRGEINYNWDVSQSLSADDCGNLMLNALRNLGFDIPV